LLRFNVADFVEVARLAKAVTQLTLKRERLLK
jgi:hypothetical protein